MKEMDIQARLSASLEMVEDSTIKLQEILDGTATGAVWLPSCAEELNANFEPQTNERNTICKGRVISVTDTFLNVSLSSSAIDSETNNELEYELFKIRGDQAENQKVRVFRYTDQLPTKLDAPDTEIVYYFEGIITTNDWAVVAGEMRGYEIEIQAFGTFVQDPVIPVTP
jgi:hypothetical protein